MSSVDKIFKLAERFARKISLGYQSADADAVEKALQRVGLWDKSAEIAPLVQAAGVPDEAKLDIRVIVDSQFNCKFKVIPTTPPPPAPLDPKAVPPPSPEEIAENKKQIAAAMALQKAAAAASAKLQSMLSAKYGAAMKAGLAKAGISITETIEVKWMTF